MPHGPQGSSSAADGALCHALAPGLTERPLRRGWGSLSCLGL